MRAKKGIIAGILVLINCVAFYVQASDNQAHTITNAEQSLTSNKNIFLTSSASSDTTLNRKSAHLDTTIVIPKEYSDKLDYLLYNWASKRGKKQGCASSDIIPVLPDSVYRRRLAALPCIMEMPYNSHVRSFIDLYTVKRRQQMEYMLGLGTYYFPLFEEVLAANNMPLELKYLPVIESALNPNAFSHMGAAGLWQFMTATGRMYGLEINSLVDERMDPIKSTHAAVRYLKDLYAIYADWNLVIAAYNCGPGNVRKAISRSNGKRDYWTIYPHLPKETRGYVPVFIAATYAMEYATEHNLCPAIVDVPIMSDTIEVRETIHLEQIASVTGIPVEQLKRLNPQYRKDIIPGKHKPYPLCLPAHYLDAFIKNYDEIVQYKADELINNRRDEIEIARQTTSGAGSSGKTTYHTVKKGQTLGGIAQKHGVSVANLRKWNKINGSMIREGQKLKIMK